MGDFGMGEIVGEEDERGMLGWDEIRNNQPLRAWNVVERDGCVGIAPISIKCIVRFENGGVLWQ